MFGKKVRTPEELVTKSHAALERLRVDRTSAKDVESVSKYFGEMRALLLSGDASAQQACETLVVKANACRTGGADRLAPAASAVRDEEGRGDGF
jgi:hypothetical protein